MYLLILCKGETSKLSCLEIFLRRKILTWNLSFTDEVASDVSFTIEPADDSISLPPPLIRPTIKAVSISQKVLYRPNSVDKFIEHIGACVVASSPGSSQFINVAR